MGFPKIYPDRNIWSVIVTDNKKGLNPLSLSLLGLHDTSLELILAVREGFEPSIRANVYTLSRRAP